MKKREHRANYYRRANYCGRKTAYIRDYAIQLAVGRRVLQRRKALGWTQAALAERAGVSPSTIYTIETARDGVSQQILERVAEALGGSLAWLTRDCRETDDESTESAESA